MGYIVRKRRSGAWYLAHETYPEGKRIAKTITVEQYPRLGLDVSLSFSEAKQVIRPLNRIEHKKQTEARIQKIHERLQTEDDKKIVYLPQAFLKGFELEIVPDQADAKRFATLWRAAKKVIAEVGISTFEWHWRAKRLYGYFADRNMSPAYVKKIIRAMNLWGVYLGRKTGTPYVPLRSPRGVDRSKIEDHYIENREKDKASTDLTPQDLTNIRGKIQDDNWNWLYVSLWFGLRPSEVDGLSKPDTWSVYGTPEGLEVLTVYQSKLKGLSKEKRWKHIPILFEEQREALKIMKEKPLKRPLPKTIKRYTLKDHHTYCGRKGFQDLMTSRGRSFVEVQSWLGHQSIERSYKSYMNKVKVYIERK